MRISKELIEKYHDGDCSREEKEVVENWLFSEESEEELSLPVGEKLQFQTEIWDEIASTLPNQGSYPKIIKLKAAFQYFYKYSAAAVIIFGMLGSAFFYFRYASPSSEIIIINNSSETVNKDLNSTQYTISVGPKSNVEINNKTGMIDFCGAMMINSKKDIELTLQGACINPSRNKEKITLKKGMNYFALNYSSDANNNEVIIVEEGSVMGLPPLVMKQLLHQFNI